MGLRFSGGDFGALGELGVAPVLKWPEMYPPRASEGSAGSEASGHRSTAEP
jgi:hypothetical protein